MKELLLLLSLVLTPRLFAQDPELPLQKNNFSRPTSYEELSNYVKQLGSGSDSGIVRLEVAGTTSMGRNIYALKFSSSVFGKDQSKIKVLIFAQQHGNEQSGKEGALLLTQELCKPANRYLFDKIDLLLVPQMNPDGSELNKRRNGHDADLNRNHLILTEPETQALHRLFDKYLFEVSMDVHEFYPFGDAWKKFGYRTGSSELLGTTTNINVSEKIRSLSNKDFLPFMKNYFNERHVSNFIYAPGGPPEIDYIRHSTFDINDGRQSFGIQNTFSFIQEGMNGTDLFAENLEKRTIGQMTGMMGLISYSYQNCDVIKKRVAEERLKLLHPAPVEVISIQNVHSSNGEKLNLPVFSYFTNKDSVISVSDYRPLVKSLQDVRKPTGYLIPTKLKDLTDWVGRQALITELLNTTHGYTITEYKVNSVDSIDFEDEMVVNPNVVEQEITSSVSLKDYLFIPTAQLKGNMIVIALEPKSMLGLVTYPAYAFLLKAGTRYPILRVDKIK
jgi:hypothetical protein